MMHDAFEVLGLTARYGITPAEVQREYLARAASLHPDRVGVEDAEAHSAALNEARSVLNDPEQRANTLLTRLGGPTKDSDKSLPTGFLAAMMEVREAMAGELPSGGEAAKARWRAWAGERRREHEARVGAMFEENPPALAAIRTELNAWRYVERLAEQIDAA